MSASSEPGGIRAMTREQVRARLRELVAAGEPDELISALCYDMSSPPSVFRYLCPTCGTVTAAPSNNEYMDGHTLPRLRKRVNRTAVITGLRIDLDEGQLCSVCSPGLEQRHLGLVVTYPDGCSQLTLPARMDDIELVLAFAEGRIVREGLFGQEALCTEARRLRKLLGLRGE